MRWILACNTVLVKQNIKIILECVQKTALERMQGCRQCLLMTKIKFYRMILIGRNIKAGMTSVSVRRKYRVGRF